MSRSNFEWLEADGLGGFASHTSEGTRTRRYHALLLVSKKPPTERMVLVNGVDVTIESDGEAMALTSQSYKPAEGDAPVIGWAGKPVVGRFDGSLWPTWTYDLGELGTMEHSVLVPRGSPLVLLSWRLTRAPTKAATLVVRPFLSGRDYHSLQHENQDFDFKPTANPDAGRLRFQPYASVPAVVALSNGRFSEQPHWYRDFLYTEDRERGLDCAEDLATPGVFSFDLQAEEALLVFATEDAIRDLDGTSLEAEVATIRGTERNRRNSLVTPRGRAAAAFVVQRGRGRTILAGYPWFTDWGRDTFISMRGLCLADGRLDEARRILLEWSGAVSGGMLPNRFADSGEVAEYNSVDAALWFIIAIHDLRRAETRAWRSAPVSEDRQLDAAIVAILRGYAHGTRHGIRLDRDDLLAAGGPGVQLTWMDAKIGDYVVTPRIGKPVEIQALWINALRIGGSIDPIFMSVAEHAQDTFRERFWNEETSYLYDVVDVDHVPDRYDGRIRPNALFAVGGLPFPVLDGDRARRVVDLAETSLVTPAGVRTLSPDDPQYRGSYQGGVWSRDTAYHQGTVWPYLMGAFVEAWVRVRGGSEAAMKEARTRFFDPLVQTLDPNNSGHFPEIADGDAPHEARGCPFQAWSLGEVQRLDRVVLRGRDH